MRTTFLFIGLLVWLIVPVQAQTVPIFWEKLESLDAGITAVATGADSTVFVGTGEGIYRSRDHDLSWEALCTYTPDCNLRGYVYAVRVTREGRLFADISGGIYHSQDDGDTWGLYGTGSPAHGYDFDLSPERRTGAS